MGQLEPIDIYKIAKWPADVIRYLDECYSVLSMRADRSLNYQNQLIIARQYDAVAMNLKPLLDPYCLHGYHCTKLTEREITAIIDSGMSLQDGNTLAARISDLLSERMIEREIAIQLGANQANDDNRKHMIWFCFFKPFIAGEDGIGRFFRSWGGEALYNSHEYNSATGPVLRKIGTPCLIEAFVPLKSFSGFTFELNFVNRYMASKGLDSIRVKHYEGYISDLLPAKNIRTVIRHPSSKFTELTRCNTWRSTF